MNYMDFILRNEIAIYKNTDMYYIWGGPISLRKRNTSVSIAMANRRVSYPDPDTVTS